MRRTLFVYSIAACLILVGLSFQAKTARAATLTPSVTNVKNANWGGYSVDFPNAQASDVIGVTGNWTVPSVSCTKNGKPISGEVAVWVGLGGVQSGNTLEQTGTDSQCIKGVASYWAWYELVPSMPKAQKISKNGKYPVSPGDSMRADVTQQGPGYFVLRIFNETRGWYYPYIWINQSTSTIPLTGEWIVEDPGNETFPQFYDVLFTNCNWAAAIDENNPLIDGTNLTSYTIYTVTILGTYGHPKETTLDVFPDGTDFSLYWNRY